jgi:hypothetical protein
MTKISNTTASHPINTPDGFLNRIHKLLTSSIAESTPNQESETKSIAPDNEIIRYYVDNSNYYIKYGNRIADEPTILNVSSLPTTTILIFETSMTNVI